MADNFQRVGAISNAHVGRDFEAEVIRVLAIDGVHVERNSIVPVGIGRLKREHSSAQRSSSPPILFLCKLHRRTKEGEHTQHKAYGLGGGNVLFFGTAKPVPANSLSYRDTEIQCHRF